MLLLSFPQSFPMLRHPFFHWCTFCTLNPCCDAQKSLQPATPGLGELPMVVKPKYPFCFPFCLVTAVIDGTRCIHFRDQCLRCAAPRIARYGVVWRWAEPSQGPACRPTSLRPRRTPCSCCVGGKTTVFVRGPTPQTLLLATTNPSGSTSTPPEASEERLRVD